MFKSLYRYLKVAIIILVIAPSANAEIEDQHVKVRLRHIAHEFLLQMEDSTTRILPIEKIQGRYEIKFANEFSFQPDALLFSTFKVLEKYYITDNYIVEVEDCETKSIIHSFATEVQSTEDLGACQQRLLPKQCYVLYFTQVEDLTGGSTEEISVKNNSIYMFIIVFVILVLLGGLYVRKKKRSLNANLINIGKYHFDKKGMLLTLKAQSVELSSKESDLLYLLFSNENSTLEREHILKVVWGDDGDYVGRTLDVFISKLRKKLQDDNDIKIINVRGVGYKLIVNSSS